MWDPVGASENGPSSFDLFARAQTHHHHRHHHPRQLLFPIILPQSGGQNKKQQNPQKRARMMRVNRRYLDKQTCTRIHQMENRQPPIIHPQCRCLMTVHVHQCPSSGFADSTKWQKAAQRWPVSLGAIRIMEGEAH